MTESPAQQSPQKRPKQRLFFVFLAGMVILVLLIFLVPKYLHRNRGIPPIQTGSGLTLEKLAIASQTLFGHWTEEDVLIDDEEQWSGTTAVVNHRDGRLVLISNSHCLGLKSLADADSKKLDAPDIKDYGLKVRFPNGQERPVLRIAETARRLDLALLEVDAKGLKEGSDFVVLPLGQERYKVGDDVVAVGSPRLLEGTHTFGKISAIRQMDGVKLIQHHADINPGNSGGPLFLKVNDRYVWIGVNTLGGGNGLGFAIDASEMLKSEFEWFNADKEGAAQIIRKLYGQPGTKVVP